MWRWFKKLDEILRRDTTRTSALKQGEIDVPVGGLSVVITILGVVYGICMGCFTPIRTHGEAWMQVVASGVKFPLLFLLTFLVTFPSLYVFNALIGSRLNVWSTLRLLTASVGVILAVAASLGPIVVFFSVSTNSYHFMVLLNVIMCSIAGVLGLVFLLRTLQRLVMIETDKELGENPPPVPAKPIVKSNEGGSKEGKAESSSSLDPITHPSNTRAKKVFRVWILVFAMVGSQMSWILRPFVGDPNLPFEWFRSRESNFFAAVIKTLAHLFE